MNMWVTCLIWHDKAVGSFIVSICSSVCLPYLQLWHFSPIASTPSLSSNYPLCDESMACEANVRKDELSSWSTDDTIYIHL